MGGQAATAPVGRRDRRRERTRNQLTSAAQTLIAAKGVAGLRIADITEAADVGRGSFYNYFDSKEDLVAAIVSEAVQALAARVIMELPDTDDPAVRASVADRRFIRLASSDAEFARLLVNLHRGDDLFAAATLPYARIALEAGIESGRFDVGNLDVVLIVLAGGAFGLIRAILAGDAPADADQAHAESILRLLGIPPAEARAISSLPLE
jgi:AcrR family transcriptional regulator